MKTLPVSAFGVCFVAALRVVAAPDPIGEWNATVARFAGESLVPSPHVAARTFAIAHRAMGDALDTVREDRSRPADSDTQAAAVAAAAYETLRALLPAGEAAFAEVWSRQTAGLTPGQRTESGIQIGRKAAAAWVARRADDRWPVVRRPETGAALLAADPAGPRRPGTTAWQNLRPFVLNSIGQFEPLVPCFVYEGEIVRNEGLRRSRRLQLPPEVEAAMDVTFWRQEPVLLWNAFARAVIAAAPLDQAGAARLLAALNSALADALLAASHWREYYASGEGLVIRGTWVDPDAELRRRNVAGFDSAPAVTSTVRIPIRDFPDVTAVLAGAAQAVLERAAATVPEIAVPAGPDSPALRRFVSVPLAAKEAAVAAMTNRGCSRESANAGFDLGSRIGAHVVKQGFSRR